MHFVIDIGNTSVKTALVGEGRVLEMFRGGLSSPEVADLSSRPGISSGICSSVRDLTADEERFIRSLGYDVLRLSAGVKLPFKLNYSTPDTLGPDRIAAVAGAWKRFPNRNILVIDAGTAITYDLVTSSGIYMGGNISPGREMRFRSLHEFTGKLPLVKADGDIPSIGYSTETAIRSGVMTGIRNEMEGYVRRFSAEHESLLVFLTGGDADLFEIPIKNRIFADGFLVLEGLDFICGLNENC